jgi:hypothetical protein
LWEFISGRLLRQIEDQGYVVVDSGLDAQTLRELDGQLDTSNAGRRNLLDHSTHEPRSHHNHRHRRHGHPHDAVSQAKAGQDQSPRHNRLLAYKVD